MATQYYLNKTGLTYLWGRIVALYQPKEAGKGLSTNDYTDADKAEVAKIAGLVAEGGQPNVIETVKVNGTALTPDADKAVNVTVPVQSVRQNSTVLTPDSNGQVQVAVPVLEATMTGDKQFYLWDDAADLRVTLVANGLQFYSTERDQGETVFNKALPDETRVNALIAAALAEGIGGVTQFRYLPVDALPATGEAGVIYLVPNSGNAPNIKDEYIWINKGTTESPDYAFELLGTTEMDLSGYLQTTDVEAITTAEIDEITGA